MSKQVHGGFLSDEANAVLDLLHEASGRKRSVIISELLETKGQAVFGRPLTVNYTDKRNGGWFNNSFNNWLSHNRFFLALRARFPNLFEHEGIPWFVWVLVGALGLLYFIVALGGF